MALLYGRAGRLTAKNGGFRPGQSEYKADGACLGQCDCGPANPCAEYTFDHRNASFSEWFVDEFMISRETLLHKPTPINGPGRLGVVKRHQNFPMEIRFVWCFCMGVQGA